MSDEPNKVETQEASYFTSYEDLSVHELMLKDEARTRTYQAFIETQSDCFRGKTVIDVGAGTGILSLFAARAGAKKVFAVEASGLAKLCAEVVAINGYSDIIEVIHSRIEEADLPIEESGADVILSEWMGFYLLHEAMLSSVIYARDRWLKPNGIMVPSVASIYMSPVNMKDFVQDNINVWDNAYGFNFEPLKRCVQEKHARQPQIETIDAKQCLAPSEDVTHLHLKYVSKEDLCVIKRNLTFQLSKNSICHGFSLWFTCKFESQDEEDNDSSENDCLYLDTGPCAPATHWKQTIVLLPEALMVNKGDTLSCKLELRQDEENSRRYNISVELDDEEEEEGGEGEGEEMVDMMDDDTMRTLLLEAMKN